MVYMSAVQRALRLYVCVLHSHTCALRIVILITAHLPTSTHLPTHQLAKQRAFIRHEKRKLLLQNALLESERERFDASLAADWFCSAAFPSARDRRVTIDVGGQLFELSSALAAKDAKSLLAALVDDDSPLAESDCGCFRVDRDWYERVNRRHVRESLELELESALGWSWTGARLASALVLVLERVYSRDCLTTVTATDSLVDHSLSLLLAPAPVLVLAHRWLFRYVLAFLRDGVLPQHNPKLLRELYLESEFWKLESLRRAIEMRNIELLQVTQDTDAAAIAMTTASLLNQSSSSGSGSGKNSLLGLRASIKSSSIAGRTKAVDAASALAQAPAKDPSAWWLDPPLWWGATALNDRTKADTAATTNASDAAPAKVSAFASMLKKSQAKAKSDAPAPAHASEHDAWWHSTTYKGVDYAQALSPTTKQAQATNDKRHEDATRTTTTTPRAPLIVHSTWASSHHIADA